jgi:hypothetical protein
MCKADYFSCQSGEPPPPRRPRPRLLTHQSLREREVVARSRKPLSEFVFEGAWPLPLREEEMRHTLNGSTLIQQQITNNAAARSIRSGRRAV